MQEKDYNENLIEVTSVSEKPEVTEEVTEKETCKDESKEEVNLDNSSEENYNQLAEVDPKVQEILDNLDSKIEKYNKTHTVEAEEKKILNSRNLVLRLKKGQIDKVVNEAKASIEKLEKECFSKINANEAEINKLQKEYLDSINELEKQTKIEVKKITDAILAPKITGVEEAIDLITATDEELFSRFLKEEEKIYDLRIDGIKKMAALKHEYYDTKHEKELNYTLKRIELKREIEHLKSKEDEEVANLRHIIKEETSRLRDEEYFTNHNAMLNLSAINYKNKIYIEKLKEKTYLEINNYYLETDSSDEEKLIHQEWYLVKSKEVTDAKALAKKEYLDTIKELNEEKNDYALTYTKDYIKEINDFRKTMASIKKQPSNIDKKYDSMKKNESLRIDNDYNDHIKNIELEEQTRLLMCKKTNNS